MYDNVGTQYGEVLEDGFDLEKGKIRTRIERGVKQKRENDVLV